MNDFQTSLHENAVNCAVRFNESEKDLLESLEQIDENKVFLVMGYASLFRYCTEALRLTESQSGAMIAVMRKSKEVPALREAIQKGEMNVSRSKRIVSIMTKSNARQWIEKAKCLPQKELEIEIVKENPRTAVPESIKPLSEYRREVRLSISSELEEKLERVKEILRVNSLEEALEKITSFYLEKKDPVMQKSPSLRIVPKRHQRGLPRSLKNRVLIRDKGMCGFVGETGKKCGSRKWVEVHHVRAFSEGGDHSMSNLITLCYGHHRAKHLAS